MWHPILWNSKLCDTWFEWSCGERRHPPQNFDRRIVFVVRRRHLCYWHQREEWTKAESELIKKRIKEPQTSFLKAKAMNQRFFSLFPFKQLFSLPRCRKNYSFFWPITFGMDQQKTKSRFFEEIRKPRLKQRRPTKFFLSPLKLNCVIYQLICIIEWLRVTIFNWLVATFGN